jgi:hypothetical protein
MSDNSAPCCPKSTWDGWKNARLTLNNAERKKSVRFLGNRPAPVAARRCSPSSPHRICQSFSCLNLRPNGASSKYDDQPRATCSTRSKMALFHNARRQAAQKPIGPVRS